MSTQATRHGDYTFDDFLALVEEHEKADLLDGVIYMASPESTDDNSLEAWLVSLMRGFTDELDLGEVYVSRVAFRITDKQGPEPDVSFLAKNRRKIVQRGFVAGAPDVAVEIVSPDSVGRDYVEKRQIYEHAGVREYWIIDPAERKATFLRLSRRKLREVELENGHIFRSAVLPGFWLDVRWFWAKRRPSAFRLLQQMIAAR
jgi:Uma2 family endonuclease